MPWNPWRALRDRPHITLAFDELAELGGGALYARRGARAAIIIDPRLPRRLRAAALAHELVHDERGPGVTDPPDNWWPIVAREETTVDKIVARRLIDLDHLADWIQERSELGPVEAWEVAEEWDVPDHVAVKALELIEQRNGGQAA